MWISMSLLTLTAVRHPNNGLKNETFNLSKGIVCLIQKNRLVTFAIVSDTINIRLYQIFYLPLHSHKNQ